MELAHRTWACRLVPSPSIPILELTYDTASLVDLEASDLISEDLSRCQDAAERLRASPDVPMIWIVPSAALPGTRNLVIFGPRVAVGYLETRGMPETDMPVAVSADDAPAPLPLLERVRYHGMPHAEFEAWLRDEAFYYDEPPFPSLAS